MDFEALKFCSVGLGLVAQFSELTTRSFFNKQVDKNVLNITSCYCKLLQHSSKPVDAETKKPKKTGLFKVKEKESVGSRLESASL